MPNRRTASTGVALLALLALGASACGSSGGSGSGSSSTTTTSTAAAPRFEDTQWVLADVTALGAGAGATSITAKFSGGTVTGNSGCNSYRGPYTLDGAKLTVGPGLASTQMACAPATNAVEAAYLARLQRVATQSVKDSTLTLAGADGATLLRFGVSGGESALAGKWTVTSIYTGDAIQSVATGTTLTAAFDAGTVSGDSGCNTFSGPYQLNGSDAIKIGPLASSLRECADPATSTQERQYLAALELAASYSVAGSRLDLLRADGGIAVTFDRA